VWIDENNTPDGVVSSLNIILNTGGCTLRGYVAESVDDGSVNHDVIMNQIDLCLEHETAVIDQPADLVKIYTSGSFLDEHEVSMKSRVAITETFADRDRIVIESSPDFVNREKLRTFTEVGLATDVAIRVETTTDRIRHDCINE
jgi:radical SAM enzyme (TIGR01210 family)